MKYKKIVKVSIAFALVISILTNSVGSIFAEEEKQVEEYIAEDYNSVVKEKEEIETKILEEEMTLDLKDDLIEEKIEAVEQEKQTASYTLSKSKFQDIHLGEGVHKKEPYVRRVIFTADPLPTGIVGVDLSTNDDGSVMGANVNGTLIVTTNNPDEKVRFPYDCSYLFAKLVTEPGGSYYVALGRDSIDLSHVDTSGVVDMSGMFASIHDLKSLDLSSFDTRQVNQMSQMFNYCKDLIDINVSSFDTRNVIFMSSMFVMCESLENINVSNFNVQSVFSMRTMFAHCNSLKSLDLSSFVTRYNPDMSAMLRNCSSLETVIFNKSSISNSNNMAFMFTECVSLTNIDLSNFNTVNVTKMNSMFAGCTSLEEVNISNFDTRNVTDMSNMFDGCNSLNSLDLSNFDTSKVSNMNSMFANCNSLTELNLNSFNTPLVTNMAGMFQGCTDLVTLDLSNFNSLNTSNMSNMFKNCSSLTTIYSEEWDTSKVTNDTDMFLGCEKVVGKSEYAITTPFDPNRIGKEVATPNNGYFTVPNLEEWNATVKYIDEDNQVVATKDFLTTNRKPEITTEKLNEFMPNGYELVNENTSLTVTQDNQVFEIEIRKIQWTLELEYQTADGNVVKTEAIQVTQLNPVVTAQTITEKIPTGYELVDTATDWAATANGEKKVIQVRAIEWTVNLEYQTLDGTILKTEAIQVTQLNPVVTAQIITEKVPTGYELVDSVTDWTATANGEKKVIQVRAIEWTVNLEYQMLDGTIIKTEAIQVTQLNPVVTAQTITDSVPTGYELVDLASDWTATVNGEKKVIQVRAIEWTVSLEYQIADGTVIKIEAIQVTQLNPVVTAQVITEKVPTGYELVDVATDWTATANGEKKVIQVREVEWTVNLEYQTLDGTILKTEAIQVTQLNPVVTAQTITNSVPTGYELIDLATDWTATANGEKKVIQVRETEWTISIEFVTENSRGVVETVTFTVKNLNPVIEAQQIMDAIPEGYYALNEIQDLRATKDGEVFQIVVVKIEEWEGIVHFIDQNGVTVKTEVYKVMNKEPMIRVEELEKVVPVEAILVKPLTELTVTKDKEEFIIEVIMPVDEETNQPEIGGDDNTTTDAEQPEGSIEGVQTGDTTQMGLWSAIMAGAVGVLAYLKRKKKSI